MTLDQERQADHDDHRLPTPPSAFTLSGGRMEKIMNTIIYIVGLIVIIGVILSYFGFR